jgi:hypothetical protein
MKIHEFDLQTELEQGKTLLEKGVLIAIRHHKSFEILLFQVNRFYVEVFYHNNLKTVQGLVSFESTDRLEPYLNDIKIPFFSNISISK